MENQNIMKAMNKILFTLLILVGFAVSLFPQNSGRAYRRSAVMNGNQVKAVYGNWGVIGQPASAGPRGAWIYETNGYIGDVSPLVGAEVEGKVAATGQDTTFFWVIDCAADRPASSRDESTSGVRQAFEPVSGYFNESVNSPALSNKSTTWPPFWPDIQDPRDPRYDPSGWAGSWNGFFGRDVFNADLETYFVMDDNADNEFSLPEENDGGFEFHPIPSNPNRFGLGLDVKVRALQWQQILAQDNIFWLYNIRNNGEFTYPRTVFGMLVGTYVGVTGTDDSPQEYDDDYSFFDVNEDLTYTGDYPNNNSRNPFWQGAVGIVGYAFLESPGNPFDGIDNDNDAAENGHISTAPLFSEDDFAEAVFTKDANPAPGFRNTYVTIEKVNTTNPYGQNVVEYRRTVHTITQDTTIAVTLGDTMTIISDVTRVVEGNAVNGGNEINPNALDGKDNDLDGLIDENYFLHYRQRRTASTGEILFDIVNPVRHVDYFTGLGMDENLIDERRDDGIDNDGDWSKNPVTGEEIRDDNGVLIDDVGRDGLPGTGDEGENNGVPDPGEPNFDALDKSESDQIGLTSFQYFTPANDIALGDDDDMRDRLRPGFFEVPTSIVNGRPVAGEDGDFLYGTGYFPLTPGQTERLSLALIYGFTVDELVKKLQTVRDIYNADYRFPIAPNKPKLRAVAGDGKVTLYWDRGAEKSFDPVLRDFDFEGYKIYKSTDPNFNDIRVVTNSAGQVVSYKAEAQFDLIDDYEGWYYPPYDLYQTLQGWSFNMGTNTGLQHSWVDEDVQNGRTYYYAVVSYDKGDEETGIIPSECTKQIILEANGNIITDVNTAKVVPAKATAGYTPPANTKALSHIRGEGFGSVEYKILDETALTGNDYDVYFFDTSNDGVDNDNDWNMATDDVGADGLASTGDLGENDGLPTPGEPNFDYKDPDELEAITTFYNVLDLTVYQESFEPNDTLFVDLQRANLLDTSVVVRDGMGNVVSADKYIVDYERGRIRAAHAGDLDDNSYLISYQYHPVYKSPYMQNSPWEKYVNDTDNFDGVTLNFDNVWKSELDSTRSGWNSNDIGYSYLLVFEPVILPPPFGTLQPVLTPANYEIRISDHVVDTTSTFFESIGVPATPRKFEIVNTTGNYNVEFIHDDANGNQYPDPLEPIFFIERDPNGEFNIFGWELLLKNPGSTSYTYQGGEVLKLGVKFPFNRLDRFRLKTEMPKVDETQAKTDLDGIQVFPNPYIASNKFEPPLPPGVTSGRGERRVYFAGLPANSTVQIFTARGEHVVTLHAGNSIFNGTLTWNLKSRENLDVAYGVYFYVIETPYGKKRGKLAVIK